MKVSKSTDPHSFDVVIVGSGINSLVAAALLGRKGLRVCVLERNHWLGGCIRTAELTLPGFKHDVFSSWHPLFVTSPAYAELADELDKCGLQYANTIKPTAAVLPDGRSFILTTSRENNLEALRRKPRMQARAYARAMADIEDNAEFIFGLLSKDPRTWGAARLMLRALKQGGLRRLWKFSGTAMGSCRKWLDEDFDGEVAACLAPWILHAGLGPEDTFSGLMGKLVAFTLEQAGMPVVKGGSANLVKAFVRAIEKHDGMLLTGQHVDRVLLRKKTAYGVATIDGTEWLARKGVICNVTPTQLYGALLAGAEISDELRQQYEGYRYGNGCMQIHLALDRAPKWKDGALDDVAIVHMTPGLDGVAKAVGEARRGLLPETATVVVGQPTAVDPTRAPDGKAILWLQLQEVPFHVRGDAAGTIPIPANGMWSDALKNAYADRIVERLARHIPGLQDTILGRAVLSPLDLSQSNINLVRGDPYSGACSIDQFFAWRPMSATPNHKTPFKKLYHIGASTHPGPGLAGTSGFIVSRYF